MHVARSTTAADKKQWNIGSCDSYIEVVYNNLLSPDTAAADTAC